LLVRLFGGVVGAQKNRAAEPDSGARGTRRKGRQTDCKQGSSRHEDMLHCP